MTARSVRTRTPWGRADAATTYAPGIILYSTPSHGGFHLGRRANAVVDPAWRDPAGWYEEDCAWAVVAHTYPDLFGASHVAAARRTLRDHYPDAWRAVTGEVVPLVDSTVLRARAFHAAHATDWIVVSASGDWHPDATPGHCVVTAVVGGRGAPGMPLGATRRYLVPSTEYVAGAPEGFVIDPARHVELTGPAR